MTNFDVIEIAINDLILQKMPNVTTTAKKYNIIQSTLQRRFKGKTISHNKGQSKNNILFINAQEGILIEYINKLSTHNIYLTIQTVENFIKKIINHIMGER